MEKGVDVVFWVEESLPNPRFPRTGAMRDLLIRLLVNTVAIYVAVSFLPGLDFDRGPVRFLAVAALFGIVNSLLRPVLAVLTCPLVLLTLGLFTIVINAVLLQFTAWLSAQLGLGFHVAGFWSAVWGALVISFVSTLLSMFVGARRRVVVRTQSWEA